MAADYTVVQRVRQRFGDNNADWGDYPIDQSAIYVGRSKEFRFSCPGIDRSRDGLLQFNAMAVSNWNNVIRINGIDIPGGIGVGPVWVYISPNVPLWDAHSLVLDPGILCEENVLYVECQPDTDGNLDDFIIDNVVVWYKTRPPQRTPAFDSRGRIVVVN